MNVSTSTSGLNRNTDTDTDRLCYTPRKQSSAHAGTHQQVLAFVDFFSTHFVLSVWVSVRSQKQETVTLENSNDV